MIKHPIPKKEYKKPVTKGNMGMTLESDIEATNQYYLDMNIAVIHKKPTPIQVVKVDYPVRSAAKITEAYYKFLQLLTLMAYIWENILTLMLKKRPLKQVFP